MQKSSKKWKKMNKKNKKSKTNKTKHRINGSQKKLINQCKKVTIQ